jgi:hypothetical protein
MLRKLKKESSVTTVDITMEIRIAHLHNIYLEYCRNCCTAGHITDIQNYKEYRHKILTKLYDTQHVSYLYG